MKIKLSLLVKRIKSFFFSYAKKHSNIRQNVGPIIDKKGEAISEPEEMSEIIGDQYEMVWVEPLEPLEEAAKMLPDEEGGGTDTETITNIDFGIEDIKESMGELDETSGSGPDEFPSIILKRCREYLAEPIAILAMKGLV